MDHLSLFSGIGGIDLAAQWAGFRTVGFVESNPFCIKVLTKNFGDHIPQLGRIEDVTSELLKEKGIKDITLLTGGFPCQPVSQAGRRRGDSDHRWLWPQMHRVIAEVKPTYALVENVTGLINMGLDACLFDLESEGYEAWPIVIPACAVGALHRRSRIFIIAALGDTSRSGCNRNDGWRAEQELENGCEIISHTESNGLLTCEITREDRGIKEETQMEECGVLKLERGQPSLAHSDEFRSQGSDNETGLQRLELSRNESPRSSPALWPDYWSTEPRICRVSNGIANRVDRVRALGNAVVPQQVFPILCAIADDYRRRFEKAA